MLYAGWARLGDMICVLLVIIWLGRVGQWVGSQGVVFTLQIQLSS